MDRSLAVAVRLVEGLSPLDVAVCLCHLRAEQPARRFPAIDEGSGEAFLDFEFADGDVASRYLPMRARELAPDERKAHMSAIACRLTEADLALAAGPCGKARAVIRVCRNKRKVHRLLRLIKESEDRGVDFSFVRDALLR
ncbi:hypothetical protein [Bovine papular stomatitis virus]